MSIKDPVSALNFPALQCAQRVGFFLEEIVAESIAKSP